MLADVDYFVRLPNGKIALLEIKTTNYNAKDHWWKDDEENHVHTIPTQWFAYMTARKFMRYMDSQLPDYMQLKRAFLYRSPMEEAISTYSDYLQMCQGQNYDMKSSQVLFPKHCNEAHDELSRYIKKCRDEQTKRAFREVYENLAEKANLTSKKLQIVCPKQTDDLITEIGRAHV